MNIFDGKKVARTAYPRSCSFIYLIINPNFSDSLFFVKIVCKGNSLSIKMYKILEKFTANT